MNVQKINRFYWVDYAKAIGISLVVIGHVLRGLDNAGLIENTWAFKLFDSIIYTFHMPLFFFLSGLFFHASLQKRGNQALVFNKIDTIVYPYILWSLLQGSFELAFSQFTNGNISIVEVLSLWQPRAQFWFLYALFCIFGLVMIAGKAENTTRYWALLCGSIVLYLLTQLTPDATVWNQIAQHLVFFVFGILFSFGDNKQRLSKTPVLVSLIVLFTVYQWFFHDVLSLKYSDIGIHTLVLSCLSMLTVIAVAMRLAAKPCRFILLIGTASMSIYILHILVSSGFRVILKSFIGLESFYIHIIFGFGAGLFIPVLIHLLIAKMRIPYVFSAPLSLMVKKLSK